MVSQFATLFELVLLDRWLGNGCACEFAYGIYGDLC